MWATFPMLREALDVIEAWGFSYKTVAFNWVKQNRNGTGIFMGLGNWTRSNSEICLLATKGKPKRISGSVRSIVLSPLQQHSTKPAEIRDRIVELMGDLPRIELFAREAAPGWDVWGNEAPTPEVKDAPADSVELARHAESVGVDAIASIPPIYFHLPEYAIAKYWNEMSAAAPNTEFVIYNIPQLAGTGLTMSLLHEMLKNPNVVAVKNSSMPTQDIQMFKDAGIAARGEGSFVVFNGPDEQFVSGRVIGADGGIGGTYAVMPELYLAMNDHINKGEIEKARAIQYDADRIIYKMCEAHGNLYAVQKEILRRMYGLELGGVRAPLANLAPEDEAIVAEAQKMIEEAIAAL